MEKINIKAKIALLECIEDVVRMAESSQSCFATKDEKGNLIPDTDSYSANRFNAYAEIINHLYKLVK